MKMRLLEQNNDIYVNKEDIIDLFRQTVDVAQATNNKVVSEVFISLIKQFKELS